MSIRSGNPWGLCGQGVNFSVAIEEWGHGGQGPGEPAEGFEQRGHRVDLGESQVRRKAQVCFSVREALFGQGSSQGRVRGGISREGYCRQGKQHVQMPGGIGVHDTARELWGEVRPKLGQRAEGRKGPTTERPPGFGVVLPWHVACGLLTLRPGMEPTPPAVGEHRVLSTGLPGKSQEPQVDELSWGRVCAKTGNVQEASVHWCLRFESLLETEANPQ